MSPHRSLLIHKISNLTTTSSTTTTTNGQNGHSTLNTNIFVTSTEETVNSKKPIQKVIPSRNVNSTYQSPNALNGNHVEKNGKTTNDFSYVKPCSPIKSTGILNHNNVPTSGVLKNGGVATPQKNGGSKLVQKPTGR